MGRTRLTQFQRAFLDEGSRLAHEHIADKPLTRGVNAERAIVAVLPFLTSAIGLQSDVAIQAVGGRLRALCADVR